MTTLIIYSNEVLFPEAPNFYEFIAKTEGKTAAYEKIEEKRSKQGAGEHDEPILLKELVEKILGGIEVSILKTHIETYIKKFAHPDLKELDEEAHDTIIMGSYPTLLYQSLPLENFAIGVDLSISESTVQTSKPVVLYNPEQVEREMQRLGFGDHYTTEPNRYGNLERLIDHVIEEKIEISSCALISNGTSATPTESYIPTILTDDEVNEMLSEL